MQSGVWEDEVKMCLCACTISVRVSESVCVCLWVSNVVTEAAHCGLRGKKVSALHQHRPTFTVKEC